MLECLAKWKADLVFRRLYLPTLIIIILFDFGKTQLN